MPPPGAARWPGTCSGRPATVGEAFAARRPRQPVRLSSAAVRPASTAGATGPRSLAECRAPSGRTCALKLPSPSPSAAPPRPVPPQHAPEHARVPPPCNTHVHAEAAAGNMPLQGEEPRKAPSGAHTPVGEVGVEACPVHGRKALLGGGVVCGGPHHDACPEGGGGWREGEGTVGAGEGRAPSRGAATGGALCCPP